MIFNYLVVVIFSVLEIRNSILASPPLKKCGLYGQPPCMYVPAPPGMTPKCASPGKTYCEHNPNYPLHVIQHLVEKYGYQRILADEQDVSFSANKLWEEEHLHHHHFYGPPTNSYLPPPTSHSGYHYDPPKHNNVLYDQKPPPVPEPIYIPKPQQSFTFNNQQIRTPNYKQNSFNAGYSYSPPSTPYNPGEWLKRFSRELKNGKMTTIAQELIPSPFKKVTSTIPPHIVPSPFRHPRSLLNETTFSDIMKKKRTKRQTIDRQVLCDTRDTFLVPQVALNTKGNWMYVVNHEDSRQLVKSETCIATECSNLCILPNGYNSRCEQKFAQKRLLSLDANGQGLYTDTFWFPSCCVCTISNQ